MEYVSIDEAKAAGGLRLVLTGGVPGPWSEAAKGVFRVRQVDYVPVFQEGGGANEALVAWTGRPRGWTAAVAGLLCGVAAVGRPNLGLVAPLLAGGSVRRTTSQRKK